MKKIIETILAKLGSSGYDNKESFDQDRSRLQKLNNDSLTQEEWLEKMSLLQVMNEMNKDWGN